jgi:hypothetical protein
MGISARRGPLALANKNYLAAEIAGTGPDSRGQRRQAGAAVSQRENDAFLIAIPFLATIRDSAALLKAAGDIDKFASRDTLPRQRAVSLYIAASLRAYAALARGDTVSATRLFDALPDSLPISIPFDLFTRARLIGRQDPRRAIEILERHSGADLLYPARELERGRLAEKIGDKERAVDAYSFVATVWQNADAGASPRRREGSERRADATRLRRTHARAALRRKALTRDAFAHASTSHARSAQGLVAVASSRARARRRRLRRLRPRRSPPSSSSRSTRSAIDFSIAIRYRTSRDSRRKAFGRRFAPNFRRRLFRITTRWRPGLTPGQHGITINQFFDPIRREWFRRTSANDGSFFKGEPIWVTAEKAGIRTAAYFWTGSEAEIAGVVQRSGIRSMRLYRTRSRSVRSFSGCGCPSRSVPI